MTDTVFIIIGIAVGASLAMIFLAARLFWRTKKEQGW